MCRVAALADDVFAGEVEQYMVRRRLDALPRYEW